MIDEHSVNACEVQDVSSMEETDDSEESIKRNFNW